MGMEHLETVLATRKTLRPLMNHCTLLATATYHGN